MAMELELIHVLSMEAAYGTGESASSCGKMCVETETAEGQFETLLGCPRFLKHLFSSPSIGSRNLTLCFCGFLEVFLVFDQKYQNPRENHKKPKKSKLQP